MGVVSVTLIAATLIYLCFYPPTWMRSFLQACAYHRPAVAIPHLSSGRDGRDPPNNVDTDDGTSRSNTNLVCTSEADGFGHSKAPHIGRSTTPLHVKIEAPALVAEGEASDEGDGQTTPKAAANARNGAAPAPVPTFELRPPQVELLNTVPQNGSMKATLQIHQPKSPSSSQPVSDGGPSAPMPPPPAPPLFQQPRIPSLNAVGSPSTLLPHMSQRNLPIPNRGPSAQAPSTSTLAPPPSISSKPTPPRRPVTLTAGHSPLDWARLSSDPSKNLSGLPPGVSYLRIAPSQLKAQNGRKGNGAWMELGGLVYNVTPYLPFHPGGVPELMRGAGRNGTKLFGEIHPWVNYEGMLSSCLVGRLVEEGQGFGQGVQAESEMEQID
jgi:cytochrome b involved in lipid metabolism